MLFDQPVRRQWRGTTTAAAPVPDPSTVFGCSPSTPFHGGLDAGREMRYSANAPAN